MAKVGEDIVMKDALVNAVLCPYVPCGKVLEGDEGMRGYLLIVPPGDQSNTEPSIF